MIIIILVISLYIYSKVKSFPKDNNSHIYKYDELKDKFKTGDIILFGCRNYNSTIESIKYICRTKIIGTEFGHIGLVYRDNNNKLYIIECTSSNHPGLDESIYFHDKNKGGARIIEMDTLMDLYSKENNAIYGVRFISEAIPNEIFLKNLEKYKKITFENMGILFILGIIDIFISNNLSHNLSQIISGENKMMCSEFAYNILHNSNAVNYVNPKIFWPHRFDNNFENFEKKPYSKIYKFSIDGK